MSIPAIWIVVSVFWTFPALAEMIVDTAWVRRHNGPGNEYDFDHTITVDASGNVYVVGKSPGSETDYHYASIKYCPNRDTAWASKHNGTTDGRQLKVKPVSRN